MKSPNEILQKLAADGWTLYRLSQATGESEETVKRAINNPEMTDVRAKISSATWISYGHLFGE